MFVLFSERKQEKMSYLNSRQKKVKAKWSFVPLLKKEISLVEGEVILVVGEHDDGWWEGKRVNGEVC